MKAENGKYVSINYVLKNDEGTIIDQSNGEPLGFVQGLHSILPKLEEAILGHKAGDKLSVVLEAKDGYGEYDEHLIAEVERKMFETDMPIEVGMAFQAMTAVGPQIVRVTKVGEDKITVDANLSPVAAVDVAAVAVETAVTTVTAAVAAGAAETNPEQKVP